MFSSPLAELCAEPVKSMPTRHVVIDRTPGRRPYTKRPGGAPGRCGPPFAGALSSSRVCALTGATLRQLQWWDEQCILKPWVNRYHRRWYTQAQTMTIARMMKCLKAGVSLRQARKLADREFVSIRVLGRPEVVDGVMLVPKIRR